MPKRIPFFLSIFFIILFTCAIQKAPLSLTETRKEKTAEFGEKQYISASELKKLIDEKNENYLLIDVRTEEEYMGGHIPTAINIPHTEIESHIDKIPKDKLIIVYCKIGGRASLAVSKLEELGYKNIINFGGINSYDYELER